MFYDDDDTAGLYFESYVRLNRECTTLLYRMRFSY